MIKFDVVIGIEIHVELNTKTKMFSSSIVDFNSEPNTNVSAVDLAYPGTLPVVNKQAVAHSVKLAKALNMKIDNLLHFDRKHYFYPDLPKGYQITQDKRPIGSEGLLPIDVDGKQEFIKIERIHMEEDTAKQNHENEFSQLDYNRAGTPLIEIVTHPVMSNGLQAAAYVDGIRRLVKALDISDAKMEEGSLRADVNISLKPQGVEEFGTKVEIKNLNSIGNIQKSIEFEITHQTKMILINQKIEMATKRFDEDSKSNIIMRIKNSAVDYKYLPEPNIPLIKLEESFIQGIKLPELPWEKEKRYIESHISKEFISQLLNDNDLADFFDSINYDDKQKLSKILFAEIVPLANSQNKSILDLEIIPNEIKTALQLLDNGDISGKHIKIIIPNLQNNNKTKQIIENNNMSQISNEDELFKMIKNIIDQNEDFVSQYKDRAERVEKFILGQLMKQSKGQANPVISTKILKRVLKDMHA